MNIDANDPRLTTYALGELEGPDRDAVEAHLTENPESRRFVDEIRELAVLLGDSLRQEQATTPTLNSVAPAGTTETPAPQPIVGAVSPRRSLGRVVFWACAATLLLSATVGVLFMPVLQSAREQMSSPLVAFNDLDPNTAPAAPMEALTSEMAPAVAPGSVDRLARAPAPVTTATAMPPGRAGGARYYVTSPQPQAAGTRLSSAPADGYLGSNMGMPGVSAMGQGMGMAGGSPPPPGMYQALSTRAAATPFSRGRAALSENAPSSGKPMGGKLGQATNEVLAEQLVKPSSAKASSESLERTPLALADGTSVSAPREADVDRKKLNERQALDIGREAKESRRDELETAPAQPPADPEPAPAPDAEVFDRHPDNLFVRVAAEPLSTFSIDVDSAGYANVRRFLNQNMLPPVDAVRIEELVNYFPYHDPAPTGDEPLAIHAEVAGCPWNPDHRLARIALSSKPIPREGRPLSNLMFLIDVSGSMNQPNKLPLVQASLKRLVEELGENDRVGIVVYAGASGLALPSTSCLQKAEILSAIDQLQAGGSTNGGAGIQLAYDEAVKHFIKGGSNRVILATDGDFNVGVTSRDDLIKLIEAKRASGVFLSVLGFGMGNLKDGQLEQLANKGNGHYAYIDSLKEAEKVLVEEMGATLNTVAKDVKLQIEFNPAKVGAYRLIGYENRLLAAQDFANDAKDAGEIGAGHHVTALYELIPAGTDSPFVPKAEPLAFQKTGEVVPSADAMVVKLRYKRPEESTSRPFETRVADKGTDFARASDDFKFAASVAGFGMLLRHSPYKGSLTYPGVLELCGNALADDPSGYRKEFTDLVRKAQALTPAR